MVKRGIGAVVLAIIAALLLGYLLKDKSRDREAAVEMKLPGAPELTIPSLSDTVDKVTDSAATLVGEATETVKSAGNNVVASASSMTATLSDSVSSAASNTADTIADSATATVNAVTQTDEQSSVKPGFSFRPPSKNEEQKINSSTPTATTTTTSVVATPKNNSVVASAPKTETKEVKAFKPTIEKEPKKVAQKKAPAKKPVTQQAAPKPKAVSSSGGKYTIQLLATSSQSRANKLAKTMNSEGYVSFITQTTSNNKVLFRVRVGGHKDRSAALSAQETMKRRYQKNFFVQNSLVVSQ